MKLLILAGLIGISTSGFLNLANAHGSKIEQVQQATFVSLQTFAAQEAKSITNSFNAVKTWISGDQIKVKAYYNSNANSVSYVCEVHHANNKEEMLCAKE